MSVGSFLPPTTSLSISGPVDAHSATGLGKGTHHQVRQVTKSLRAVFLLRGVSGVSWAGLCGFRMLQQHS